MATNFGPESTPIDPNILMLVKSYLSRIYIERATDFKTTFLANFALTTPLMKLILRGGWLTNLANSGEIIFFKFWIKEGFDGFLPNRSFVAKIMIQSINKSEEIKRGHI
jgi:hypothetical protein